MQLIFIKPSSALFTLLKHYFNRRREGDLPEMDDRYRGADLIRSDSFHHV